MIENSGKKIIMLVDEITKHDIDTWQPSIYDGFKESNLVVFKDIEGCNWKVKCSHTKQWIPFSKPDEKDGSIAFYVSSPLYKNRFYALHEFDGLFIEDMTRVLYDIAKKMGCKEYWFDGYRYVMKDNKRNASTKTEGGAGYNSGVSINVSETRIEDWQNKHIDKEERHSKAVGSAAKVSKEELAEYIESEGINIEIFPGIIPVAIKGFLSSGECDDVVVVLRMENFTMNKEYTSFSNHIEAHPYIPIFEKMVGGKYNSQSAEESMQYSRKEIVIKLVFN
ncbi:hypothetical protein BKN38_08125 [Helicobacter sp. CLO-3]|uniref:hypothetical protein n=1 Tax=unclassified Helicobacter TaxID=2593540 RepID=UPI000804FD00|nr:MULTISPECIES: hypothetical protein [unclassified Helicobacter]OBV28746.1 hypothetical protein BA723_08130 [Helicobacter sp. CLO-3]OHU81851.1 hypothetical protein BKN38_08125 [Helicobacter sp. CLO-3]